MRWTFDENVAADFDRIARTNIPNYHQVIERCAQLALYFFHDKKTASIIDVGSARGQTLTSLEKAGFKNILGVESSKHMIAASALPDRVVLSEHFPVSMGPFDMVLANWTLHFIHAREAYIKDIFTGIAPGGVFILTERMLGTAASYNGYLDFKRNQGVSETEIHEKEKALEGVLVTRPLSWYLNILNSAGFIEIEVIDAAWCFNTILCRKPQL